MPTTPQRDDAPAHPPPDQSATRIRRSRRELLKMAPLLGAGVLLVPSGRQAIIEGGLALSDRAGAASFRTSHLAPTFGNAEVTPLDRFPLNSYLAHDPELNLARWRLLVEGMVSRPGEYTLDAIRQLPKVRAEHASRVHRGLGRDRQFRRRARVRRAHRDWRRIRRRGSSRSRATTTTTRRSRSTARVIRSRCSATRCTASR